MSLQELKAELAAQVTGGNLSFTAIGGLVDTFGLVIDRLPPISGNPITGAQLTLSGQGPDQALTIAGTVDWGLMRGTAVAIVVSADPDDPAGYVVSVTLTAPDSVALTIPDVPWISLGRFQLRGRTEPAGMRGTELIPPASLDFGTTLLISGDTSKTPIPIRIGNDPIGALLVSLDTSAIELPSVNDVLAVFGSGASAIRLPGTINELLSFSLQEVLVAYDPQARTVSQIGVQIGKGAKDGAGWPVIPGFFTLDSYTIGLDIADPLGTALAGGLIAATGKLGTVDIGVSALHPATGGWQFSGYLGKSSGVPIGDLLSGLALQFGVTLPRALASFTLNDFEFAFDTATYDVSGHFSLDFDVNGTAVDLTAAAAFTHDKDKNRYSEVVSGTLRIGSQEFTVDFGDSGFTGSWRETGSPLGFADIAACFGFTDVPPIPAGLDLALTEATLSYDFGRKTLMLTAKSATFGAAVFAAVPVATESGPAAKIEYFFALSVGAIPGLGDLPVVGGALAAALAIQDVQIVLSSSPITQDILTALGDLNLPDQLRPPPGGTADTIALSLTLDLAGTKLPLSVGMGQAQSSGSNTVVPAPPPGSPVPPPTPPGSTDGTTWFTVQRTIGPLTLRRAGVRYATGALGIALDASLSAGGLEITLLGLAISSPLSSFRPVLSLDGLGIEFSRPPLAIGGAFAAITPPPPGVSWEYAGGGVVSVPEYQLSALGTFAEADGHPSMFVFARLNADLGGPPAFFVTGIAAGFGYNSALRIPARDQVPDFPLVAGSAGTGGLPGGTDPLAVLNVLTGGSQPWVSAALGEVWAAAGVSFTSFDLVGTQALLIAEFGTDLIVALIGLSTARFPRTGTEIYAQAQLGLEVVIDTGAASFAATALLAPNSYLLDPSCALTGGFAFCFWFGPNPHAGDFVLTLGGYSPYFTAPAWYPPLPRVGFTWHVSSTTTVSGTVYFALTPAAIMAGGELAVNFHDGNLSAWLTAHADVIAWWEPFHFRADIGVSIGACYTFDFLGTSKTITIELGADVDLWGPPTGGTATVHYWILSFTVSFGAGPTDDPKPLGWKDFSALLPAAPLQLAATAGLDGVETAKDGKETWIVRSGSFAFTSSSAVPAASARFGGEPPLTAVADHISILPMQATATSVHVVKILRDGKEYSAPPCTATAVSASVPAAMWGPGDGRTLTAPDKQLVDGLLTGMSVVVNPPALAVSPGVISLADALGYDTLPPRPQVPVTAGGTPAGPLPQAGTDTIGAIATGIDTEPVTTARGDLHKALTALGFAVGVNAPMTEFASQARSMFTYEPLRVPA